VIRSPQSADIRPSSRHYVQSLRVPKSNGTLDTATLAKIIQGWRRLPLGYQKTAGPPPMAESRRVTPPPAEGRFTAGPLPMAAEPSDHPATRRGPVYSGTTANGRRAVGSPRHPPMAGVGGTTANGHRAVRAPRHPPMAGVQRDPHRPASTHHVTPPTRQNGQCTAGPP
jgi:hypothetical protein